MRKVYLIAVLLIGLIISESAFAQSSLSNVETTLRVSRVRQGGVERILIKIKNRLDVLPSGPCLHTIRGLATSTNKQTGATIRLRSKSSSAKNVIFKGFTRPVDGDEDKQTKLTVFAEVDCADDDIVLTSAPFARNVTCEGGVSRARFTSELRRFVR